MPLGGSPSIINRSLIAGSKRLKKETKKNHDMAKRMNQDKKQTKSDHGYFSYFGGETAARLAQLRERLSAERDVAD